MPSSTDPGDSISLNCPSCNARLRASRKLIGRDCPCPRCRHRVTVRQPLPSDSEVHLVFDAETTPSPSRFW